MPRLGILMLMLAGSLGLAYGLGMNPAPQFIDMSEPNFNQPLAETKAILEKQAPDLNPAVMNTVLTALECAKEAGVTHTSILAVIDYSLPSSQKRLWIFDLAQKKLVFYTYITHGFNSGVLNSPFFSNTMNSKSSSLGVFETQQAYKGRYGTALKLYGFEENFNDNAYKRFVVMHGAWYVSEWFVEKYGRAGRSWGCPAVSLDLVQPIIEILQDGAFMVAYYPEKKWLAESKFLNCASATAQNLLKPKPIEENIAVITRPRNAIVFVDLSNNGKLEENEAILTVRADDYQRIFNVKPPLEQMLRRQINNVEYIGLSDQDIKKMMEDKINATVYFIVPLVEKVNGYYATEMKIIDTEKIKDIEFVSGNYRVHFDKKPSLILKSTEQFIRWLGL